MILKERIPTPAPEASASYDFQDIEEGVGFVSFRAATTSGSTILTRRSVYSNTISTIKNPITGTHAKDIDLDFDTAAFNLPRVLKGTAIISVPLLVQAGSQATSGYSMVEVKHWDGTTETSLGRSTSGSYFKTSGGGSSQIFSGSQLHKIALTEKVFKVGNILRITVEGYSLDGNGLLEIGHDPQNRNSSTTFLSPTELIADIPFKLDL